jgi:aminopeptidase N
VRFYARAPELQRVELDFAGLAVESVSDDRGRPLEFGELGETLWIELREPLRARDSAEVRVRYGGSPRTGLWFAGERDGVPTQVFTQGQCEDSHYWFPCIDAPDERATSSLRVRMPAGWRSIAAGERIESLELASGERLDTWSMSAPHPAYLTTLVAGEFVELTSREGGTPLVFAAAPEYEAALARTFEETPQILQFFGELTGARYPFAKYSQACVDGFPMGGMENVSATTLTDLTLGDERFARDSDAVPLLAHEASHQWFGDLLTCADWSHVWLNESFATYAELLYLEATRDPDDFRAALRDSLEGYLAADVGAERRPHVWNVYREPFDLFVRGGQTYPGGASRLHYLRFVLGDDAFFRGLKRYVADHRGRAVVTGDFRASMERESGRDLRPFFRQWFESAGYPELAVRWTWDDSRRVVRVAIDQVQGVERGTPGAFELAAELEIRSSGGLEVHRIELAGREEAFEFPADSRPEWVELDPHRWIPARIRYERGAEEWLALALGATDVNSRRDALATLGATLAESSDGELRWRIATAVMECAAHPSAAVRSAAARAFRRVFVTLDSPIAQSLTKLAASDPEASVRVAALESLAHWPRDPALGAFAREQYDAGYSWATMGAAAALLVVSEPDAAEPWLEAELRRASPRDLLATNLCGALSRLPDIARNGLLLGIMFDEARHSEARERAARTLVPLLAGREEHSSRVADLLARTRSYRLEGALIDLLGSLGGARSREALREHYARCLDARHKRSIEEHVRRIDA